MIASEPVLPVQLEPLEAAIRRERDRVFQIELETGEMPSTCFIEFLCSERSRGLTHWPVNL